MLHCCFRVDEAEVPLDPSMTGDSNKPEVYVIITLPSNMSFPNWKVTFLHIVIQGARPLLSCDFSIS